MRAAAQIAQLVSVLALLFTACDDDGASPDTFDSCTLCVVSIEPTHDTTLYDDPTGTTSNGSGNNMFVGLNGQTLARRALVRFDIAAFVPANATIDSARLVTTVTVSAGGPQQAALFRLLTEWGEGASDAPGTEEDGTAAAPGDATWLNPFFPDSLWSFPGGDFRFTTSGTTRLGGSFTESAWAANDSMTADIQFWLDNPERNYGWLIAGNELTPGALKGLATRENIVLSRRPRLQIFYRP